MLNCYCCVCARRTLITMWNWQLHCLKAFLLCLTRTTCLSQWMTSTSELPFCVFHCWRNCSIGKIYVLSVLLTYSVFSGHVNVCIVTLLLLLLLPLGWLRGTAVERRSLASELSLSCTRPVGDR